MRGNELSKAQRERVIDAYLSGIKQNVILAQLNISTSTIYDTIKKYKETGFAIPKKYSGCPKELSQHDTRTLQYIVYTNQFSPLSDIRNELNSNLNTTLHNSIVRRYLHDVGLGSYTIRKKSLLTEKHRNDRLRWCKEKRNWEEEWKQMV